ncbi:MAG TPA: Spy/CpxP family protein refolding chaperone [Pyrinomonadaceae bacterium]|jgi:Spy/CpxP family protein refolding chaperone|nr:Spy/CpxP family protein refolding chaperone [Pyrinomonadaceae bacterium]
MVLGTKFNRAGLVLGLLLIVLSVPAFAQQPGTAGGDGADTQRTERGPGHRRWKGRGDRGFMRILRELNLTEAQAEQARIIIENHKAAIEPQRQELLKLREQREQGADQADLRSRAKALREQIHESATNMHAQLLSILTPDQRAKLDQMETERKARRAERRERRQPPQENQEQ